MRSTSRRIGDGIRNVRHPLHDDELRIDLSIVRALVDRARPDWASLPLTPLRASGSTNALFRLGHDLLVRLPRQPGGSAAIEKEAHWLPKIGPRLPVSTPQVVAVGEPDLGYPERWSVVRWLEGELPTVFDPQSDTGSTRLALAHDLAAVVTALRSIPVPHQARTDPRLHSYRGDPLASLDDTTRRNVAACRDIPRLDVDLDAALEIWDQAIALRTRGVRTTTRWYHGDLLAENLLVRDGRLAAVLDFGGLGVGDPTVDLVVAWELLDPSSREVFRRAVGVDETSWLRGRAWALGLALMTFPYYWSTMPDRCASRLAVARSVLDDAAPR
jgi:aminoglycoside phosphotransferase (APT) family kinase protein